MEHSNDHNHDVDLAFSSPLQHTRERTARASSSPSLVARPYSALQRVKDLQRTVQHNRSAAQPDHGTVKVDVSKRHRVSSATPQTSKKVLASLLESHHEPSPHTRLLSLRPNRLIKPFRVVSSLSMTSTIRSRAEISRDLSVAQMELAEVARLLHVEPHQHSAHSPQERMELELLAKKWEWEFYKLTSELDDLRGDSSMVALLPPVITAPTALSVDDLSATAIDGGGEDLSVRRTGVGISQLTSVGSSSFMMMSSASSVDLHSTMTERKPPPKPSHTNIASVMSRSSLMAHVDHDLKRMGILRPLPIVRELPLAVIRRLKLHARAAKQRLREKRAVDWHEMRLRRRIGREMIGVGKKYLRAAALHRRLLLRQWFASWRSNCSDFILMHTRGHAHLRSAKRGTTLRRVFVAWKLTTRVSSTLLALERCRFPELEETSPAASLTTSVTLPAAGAAAHTSSVVDSPLAGAAMGSATSITAFEVNQQHPQPSPTTSKGSKSPQYQMGTPAGGSNQRQPTPSKRQPPPPSSFTLESRLHRTLRLHELNEMICELSDNHAHAAVFAPLAAPTQYPPHDHSQIESAIAMPSVLMQSSFAFFVQDELERLLWRLVVVKAFVAWRVVYVHDTRHVKQRRRECADEVASRQRRRHALECWRNARRVQYLGGLRNAKITKCSFLAWRDDARRCINERKRLQEFVADSENRCRRLLFGRWCRLMPNEDQRNARDVDDVARVAKGMRTASYLSLYGILSTWMLTAEVDTVMGAYVATMAAAPLTSATTSASIYSSHKAITEREALFGSVLGPTWGDYNTRVAVEEIASGGSSTAVDPDAQKSDDADGCGSHPARVPSRALAIASHVAHHPQLLSQLSLDAQWLRVRVTYMVCFLKWRVHVRFHRSLDALLTVRRPARPSAPSSGTIPPSRPQRSVLASATYNALDALHLGSFVDPQWWVTAKVEADAAQLKRRSSSYMLRRSSSVAAAAVYPPVEDNLEDSLNLPAEDNDSEEDIVKSTTINEGVDPVTHQRDGEQCRSAAKKLARFLQTMTSTSGSDSESLCLITQLAMLLVPQPTLSTLTLPSSASSSQIHFDTNRRRSSTAASTELQDRASATTTASSITGDIDTLQRSLTANPSLCALFEACLLDRQSSLPPSRTSSNVVGAAAASKHAALSGAAMWWSQSSIQSIHAWTTSIEQRFTGVVAAVVPSARVSPMMTTDSVAALATVSSDDDIDDVAAPTNQSYSIMNGLFDTTSPPPPPPPLTRGELLAIQRINDIRKIGSLNCRSAAASYAREPMSQLGFLGSEVTINVYNMFVKKKGRRGKRRKSSSPTSKKKGNSEPPPSADNNNGTNLSPSVRPVSPPAASAARVSPTTFALLGGAPSSAAGHAQFQQLPPSARGSHSLGGSSTKPAAGSAAAGAAPSSSSSSLHYGDVIAVSVLGSTAARTLLRVPSDEAIRGGLGGGVEDSLTPSQAHLHDDDRIGGEGERSTSAVEGRAASPPVLTTGADNALGHLSPSAASSRSPDTDRILVEEGAALAARSGLLTDEPLMTGRLERVLVQPRRLSSPFADTVANESPLVLTSDEARRQLLRTSPPPEAARKSSMVSVRSPICGALLFAPTQSFITVVTAPDDTPIATHLWIDDSMREVQQPWAHSPPSCPEIEALLPAPPPANMTLDLLMTDIPVQSTALPSSVQTTARRRNSSGTTPPGTMQDDTIGGVYHTGALAAPIEGDETSVDVLLLPNNLRSLQLFSWERSSTARHGGSNGAVHFARQRMGSSAAPAGGGLRRPTSALEVRRSTSVSEPQSIGHKHTGARSVAAHAETLFGARECDVTSELAPTVGFPAQALRKLRGKRPQKMLHKWA